MPLGSPTAIFTLAAWTPPADSIAYTFHPCFPSSHWFYIEALWMSLERHLLIRKLGVGFGPIHGILWMHENLTCRDQPRTKRLKNRVLWALLEEDWDHMKWKKVPRGLLSLSKLHRREKSAFWIMFTKSFSLPPKLWDTLSLSWGQKIPLNILKLYLTKWVVT